MHPQQAEEHGSFEELSFSLLLIKALDQRWTGTLLIEPPFDMLHAIQIDRGLVSRVLVPDNYARLGEIVVDSGVIMESELELALGKSLRLGEALAEERLIDERTLQRALVLQILKRLVRVFDFPLATQWTFLSDLEAFRGMAEGVRIDTLRVLWAGLSAHGEMGHFQETTLARIGDSSFQLRTDAQASRFGFTGDAARVVGLINAERLGIQELLEAKVAPPEVCRRIVYMLAITRYLEFSPVGEDVDAAAAISSTGAAEGDEAPASPPSSSDSDRDQAPRRVARIKLRRVAVARGGAALDPPGSGRSVVRDRTMPSAGSAEAVMAEVKARLARLDEQSPFSLLGVEPEALRHLDEDQADEMLWDAFERASRRWHPDNCLHDSDELRASMQLLHEAIAETYVSLADPDVRDALLSEHFGEPISLPPRSGGGRDTVVDPPPRRRAVTMPSRRGSSERPRPRIPTPQGVPRIDAPTSSQAPDTDPQSSGRRRSTTPAGEPRSPSELHERALVALAQERLSEALRLCLLASDAAPDNGDYIATSVWIRASMPSPDLKVLIHELDDLLLQQEDHLSARYYRGVLRRRLGYDAAARQDLERVLSIDPEHAGAQHQLRELARASEL